MPVGKSKFLNKLISFLILFVFFTTTIIPVPVSAALANLPQPTQFVPLSSTYSFPVLKGLKFDPANPLKMEFLVDYGNKKDKLGEEEIAKLIRYFLAGLTVPPEELWVNLSTYEKDRIITPRLSQTEFGEGLLSQDYILKQLSSSLMYPESETGKSFWSKTYQEVSKIANSAKAQVNTFNKIWIVPEKAEVYESNNSVWVTEATLKTLLDQDYLALSRSRQSPDTSHQENFEQKQVINRIASSVMRAVILPKINADVNSGKNFSTLRQIYYSLILSAWFKQKFQDSIYKAYINQGKVKGIDLSDPAAKDKVFGLYAQAFTKGLYNYTKTDADPVSNKITKRQYFSGGVDAGATEKILTKTLQAPPNQELGVVDINLNPEATVSSAILLEKESFTRDRALGLLNEAWGKAVRAKNVKAKESLWYSVGQLEREDHFYITSGFGLLNDLDIEARMFLRAAYLENIKSKENSASSSAIKAMDNDWQIKNIKERIKEVQKRIGVLSARIAKLSGWLDAKKNSIAKKQDNYNVLYVAVPRNVDLVKKIAQDIEIEKVAKVGLEYQIDEFNVELGVFKRELESVLSREKKALANMKKVDNTSSPIVTPSTKFKIGYEPQGKIPAYIDDTTSSFAAAALTHQGLRGKAFGLNKNDSVIEQIKDEADGLAKKIFEEVIHKEDTPVRVRVSEGFDRDGVAESFKAADVINPKGGKSPRDAIIDVIEGTNPFVTNVENKSLEELKDNESGATSIIITGEGVESLGNAPDFYADGIFTLVPKDKRESFKNFPLDPEATAKSPKVIGEYLNRIAEANNISIDDLEVVLMDRTRETQRLAVLIGLQKRYTGLVVTTITDGTVAQSLLANLGRKEGKHKIVMTVGGAPEGFFNLAAASIFREEGALASVRLYSKDVNKNAEGMDAQDLSRRYDFNSKASGRIIKLRPEDAADILNGNKLFTQEDVKGNAGGSMAFITNNGVFRVKGAEKTDSGYYKVMVLRFGKVEGKPSAWFEEKIVDPVEMKFVEAKASSAADTALQNGGIDLNKLNLRGTVPFSSQASLPLLSLGDFDSLTFDIVRIEDNKELSLVLN